MSGSKRIEWIDVAKGVGIVLVSFGHLRNGDGESVWLPALDVPIDAIYLFHMPLFFLLGGLTFSRRGGFKAFLARKAKTLLVPYYVFSLYFLAKPFAILLIPSMRATFQTSHDYGITHQFLDVLIMGNGLWFLMAFFVGECLMYGLTSLTDDGRVLAAIGMAFVILSTFVSSQTGWPALPFQIAAGVKAAGYMCVGYVLKEWLKAIPRGRAGVSSACAAVVFLTLAVPAVAGIVPDGPALLTRIGRGSIPWHVRRHLAVHRGGVMPDAGLYRPLQPRLLRAERIDTQHHENRAFPSHRHQRGVHTVVFTASRGPRGHRPCARAADPREPFHTTLDVVGHRQKTPITRQQGADVFLGVNHAANPWLSRFYRDSPNQAIA